LTASRASRSKPVGSGAKAVCSLQAGCRWNIRLNSAVKHGKTVLAGQKHLLSKQNGVEEIRVNRILEYLPFRT
jgi:hypothetical protein